MTLLLLLPNAEDGLSALQIAQNRWAFRVGAGEPQNTAVKTYREKDQTLDGSAYQLGLVGADLGDELNQSGGYIVTADKRLQTWFEDSKYFTEL